MIPVSTAQQVRALDARVIDGVGVPGPVLMENAGRLATEVLLQRWPDQVGRGVLVLCGKGNNGGDGYVMARHLLMAGVPVDICGLRGEHSPDAELNRGICQRLGVRVDAPCEPEHYGVVVDALLGTGLSSAPRGIIAERVERTVAAGRPVLAVDVPTGLHSDLGAPLGPTIRATVTVTFGRLKAGLFLEPGPDWCGDVVLADIGLGVAEHLVAAPVAGAAADDITPAFWIPEPADVAAWLPHRAAGGHKGAAGHLAVVAGSAEKTGAAVLCANAAMRTGAGLVTLFLPRAAWARLGGLRPEVMVEPLEQVEGQVLGATRFQAVAVGPGMGVAPDTVALCRRLWRQAPIPAVFDADGINALVGAFHTAPWPRLITPHPGEAARLLGVETPAVQRDRLAALRQLAGTAAVLLKGRNSLQSGPRIFMNPTGGPQLASAGTGDVLTGVAAALLARGLPPEQAGIVAAFLHGYAAELAGAEPLLAGDVLDALPVGLRTVHARRSPMRQVGRVGSGFPPIKPE